MRVTFIAVSSESLGISQLSSIIKQYGHQVNLLYSPALFNDRLHITNPTVANLFDDRKHILKKIEKENPDVLAFSAVSGTYLWLLSIAEDAKKLLPHVKIIFGGIHPTAVPERVLKKTCVDYVCIGEGDLAFPKILEAIETKNESTPIINTCFKNKKGQTIRGEQTGFIQTLDTLPLYDKPLWEDYLNIDESYITMTSRGCPYRCSFCFNSYYYALGKSTPGKYIRQRSAEHVLLELRQAKARYAPRLIEFFDDIFTMNKPWLKNFLYRYKKEINIRFQIFTHVRYIDEDVAKWLNEAGCIAAQIGIQSLDEQYKKTFLNRFETNAQIEYTVKVLRKYHIHAKFDHMIGLPGEPIEAFETARKFYSEHTPYKIQTYWINYYPKTKLIETALTLQLIDEQTVEKINEGEGFDSFTKSNKNINPQYIKLYNIYELIFKLIPACPKRLRKKITPKLLKYLPNQLCPVLSFSIDVISGLLVLNPDHFQYLKYYFYHIKRSILSKFGIRIRPLTKTSKEHHYTLAVPKQIKNLEPE